MITAWMGQGQDDKAIATCRLLSRCRDPKLRQQAKQLLGVLEAPSLDRPERWSMRMPQLELNGSGGEQTSTMRRRRSRPPNPRHHHPRGRRVRRQRVSVLVMAVLLGITLLLSGCVRIEADLDLRGGSTGPHLGRAQHPGTPIALAGAIQARPATGSSGLKIEQTGPGRQQISSRVASSRELAQQMAAVVTVAGRAAGVSLPAPVLKLEERNWLLGVQQHVQLMLDLGLICPRSLGSTFI